jgi:cobalt/nickel transport system permease protein
MLRSWVSVQMAIVMTASTPFPDLVHAMRHLRMPDVLVSIVSFMYRYLFVLADEVMRMLRAREARSAKVPGQKSGGALLWRARIAGSMVGQLLLRSLDRSERVYNAMVARGYKGVMMTINPHVMRPDDWILGVVVIASLLGIQILSRS